MDKLKYTGDFLREKRKGLDLEVYDPSPELVEAVNLAILLKQPLLVMGEPGCGKTRLAESVAAELHGAKYQDHYFRWDVKSSSKAKEGIYQYDALRRLYDANARNKNAAIIAEYISYGPLATAFTEKPIKGKPNVLLIDEIDKADIDFPNDLLLEIEKGEFQIPELGNEKIKRTSDVVLLITSNRERELPPAFLRRCLYHYIGFPKQEELEKIVKARFDVADDSFVKKAVSVFLDIRAKLDKELSESEKKPSTSELLEWFSAMTHHRQEITATIDNYEQGTIEEIKIPFPQTLFKTWESHQLFTTA